MQGPLSVNVGRVSVIEAMNMSVEAVRGLIKAVRVLIEVVGVPSEAVREYSTLTASTTLSQPLENSITSQESTCRLQRL